ncbi:MAG TPA: hypothetical protein [Caudoviricetes sp.]|nr:MAG TPA: hypothetical protein [Caudoviricetes sp.]
MLFSSSPTNTKPLGVTRVSLDVAPVSFQTTCWEGLLTPFTLAANCWL